MTAITFSIDEDFIKRKLDEHHKRLNDNLKKAKQKEKIFTLEQASLYIDTLQHQTNSVERNLKFFAEQQKISSELIKVLQDKVNFLTERSNILHDTDVELHKCVLSLREQFFKIDETVGECLVKIEDLEDDEEDDCDAGCLKDCVIAFYKWLEENDVSKSKALKVYKSLFPEIFKE